MKTGGQLATDAGDILPDPPPITTDAKAAHRYRGQCNTCHTIINKRTNPPLITKNAKPPHGYRGRCANCHIIR
ncbi:MAG: magnetochrome domain-containing protein [Planctomycetota bacterium]|jgi:hypothetical protein